MALVVSVVVVGLMIGYLVSAALLYGLTLGYFDNEYGVFWNARTQHLSLAVMAGLMGPLGLIPYLATAEGEYKWKLRFWPRSYEDCLAEHKKRWPSIDPKQSGF